VELQPGAAAYLPLHAWHERDLLQEGADPLLGMLAVFNTFRRICALFHNWRWCLCPPTWSRLYRRKSVEHPLEQERLRARLEGGGVTHNRP